MDGIEFLLSTSRQILKVNMVVIGGVNDDKIQDMVKLLYAYPLQLRFIEYMPFDSEKAWTNRRFVSAKVMMARLQDEFSLKPVEKGDSPHPLFGFQDSPLQIGVIAAYSRHFCSSCNRLRLGPDGTLAHCLYSRSRLDLSKISEDPGSASFREGLHQFICEKSRTGILAEKLNEDLDTKPMNRIGG